ncbi:unnamed protein product [Acanthoscelides obtectus]|uniref:Uncharacterized protein n=1 Tax=Acanthoscelides obtectus TaxID=200917 RepID=A0A9P0KEN0_ACAOB|nr:unnamed protein product [Acanthoscelides obtectus]CAK1635027.1 hypothetical protein AOBTE_LOCUS9009 [Acanthoscelides obtectus]
MTVAAFRLFRFRASSEKLPLCLSPATALLTTLLTFLLTLGTSTVNAQERCCGGIQNGREGGGCCINAKKRRNAFVVTSEQGVIGRVTTSEILRIKRARRFQD